MNEGHGAGPQLVGQLTEDDPVGQSLGQVIGQRPLQLGLKHLGDGKEGERSASPEEVPGWARRRLRGSQEAWAHAEPRLHPHESHLSYLAQLSHHLLFVQKLGGSPRSQDSVW